MTTRDVTRYLLWIFVFTAPWDTIALPYVGSVSRAAGLAVSGAALVTVALEGRLRKPDAVLVLAIAFAVWNVLSLMWTIAYATTYVVASTYVQLILSVVMIREFVRTEKQMQSMWAALCFGLFIPLIDLLNNFRLDAGTLQDRNRFTGFGFNADAIGLFLVLGVPIGWHLLIHGRGLVRFTALTYAVAAPLGLLLTATRGAFVAGFAAFAIVPLTLYRQSWRTRATAVGLLLVAALAAVIFVPQDNWDRVLSTGTEVKEGSMSGRTELWNAGWQAFPARPLIGAGPGAFGEAVAPYLQTYVAASGVVSAHNVMVGTLVEYGIIGLSLFVGIFAAAFRASVRAPYPYGALCGVLVLTWLVGGMSGNPEMLKFTWVLLGLISAQSGLVSADDSLVEKRRSADGWTDQLATISR
jgi:O-antigen ligase